jgi:hypothetical protein
MNLRDKITYFYHIYLSYGFLEESIKKLGLDQEMMPTDYVKISYNNKILMFVKVEENHYDVLIRYGNVHYTMELGQEALFKKMKEMKENV